MKRTVVFLLCILSLLLSLPLQAQEKVQGFVHQASDASGYVWPEDSLVLQKLDKWQDLKFGVLFHWGLYSVPGIVESWSICSEDEEWINRRTDMTYDEYKRWYWALQDSLCPTKFDASRWADIMQDAGMKYMLFTTKHHDGFCMYDSKYTDFSIAHGPFANDPRRDVTRHVLDAFRDKGFMAGCYFSKPDWHCPWFWNDHFATATRRINYKKDRHPDWWENYRTFTQHQLEELTTDYGRIDILWLDGGWITGDDIGLDEVLQKARTRQPGLIAVDRTIRGRNENYQTPERSIPATQQNHPWESCITLSNDWGWVPNAPYKSARKVIALLSEVTAKGGCLLLGIGPTAQGEIEPAIIERMHSVGLWLRANGKAIYDTRTTPVYQSNGVWFTADKDGRTLYAIRPLEDGASQPETIEWEGNAPKGKVTILETGERLKTRTEGGRTIVTLPRKYAEKPVALSFRIK